MKNRLGSSVAALVLLGITFAVTNPSEEKHRDALLDRAEETGGKALRTTLDAGEKFTCFFGGCLDYRNYVFFSTMHTDKGSDSRISVGFLGMVF